MGLIITIVIIFILYSFFKGETDPKQNQRLVKPKIKRKVQDKSQKKEKVIYATIRFKYNDLENNITERTVDVMTGKKNNYFSGYCHLRKARRDFYFAGMRGDVVNVTTGEALLPMEWRHQLQGTAASKKAMEKEAEHIAFENNRNEGNDTWLKLTSPAPVVEFEGKRFTLGGYFDSGNIDACKEKVTSRGGIIQAAPNGKTDFIVVNPDEGVSNHYQSCIKKLLDRNITPIIISEDHWLDSM